MQVLIITLFINSFFFDGNILVQKKKPVDIKTREAYNNIKDRYAYHGELTP